MRKQKPDARFYRRNLPHIQPENAVLFITYNLDGAIPKKVIERLRLERELKIKELEQQDFPSSEIRHLISQTHEFYFGKYDALLDGATTGPTYLKQPEVADEVMKSLHWVQEKMLYKLVCYTIMSNHVHKVVYKTQKPLWRIMQSHKSFTGIKCNKIIGREGALWQHESFDHKVRNRQKFIEKVQYTLMNSVKAGLVRNWRDYPYSYLNPEFEKYAP